MRAWWPTHGIKLRIVFRSAVHIAVRLVLRAFYRLTLLVRLASVARPVQSRRNAACRLRGHIERIAPRHMAAYTSALQKRAMFAGTLSHEHGPLKRSLRIADDRRGHEEVRYFYRLHAHGQLLAGSPLPIFPTAAKQEIFQAIQASNPGAVPLPGEFVISSCPGDFTNVVGSCKVYANVDGGTLKLTARTYAPPGLNIGCSLTTGTQYYLNVRNVDTNNVNACPGSQCSMIIQHHGG